MVPMACRGAAAAAAAAEGPPVAAKYQDIMYQTAAQTPIQEQASSAASVPALPTLQPIRTADAAIKTSVWTAWQPQEKESRRSDNGSAHTSFANVVKKQVSYNVLSLMKWLLRLSRMIFRKVLLRQHNARGLPCKCNGTQY